MQPEVYSALTQAHRHEETKLSAPWYNWGWRSCGYKSNKSRARLEQKHRSKAQKLRAKAIKLSGDSMITQRLQSVGMDQILPNRFSPKAGAVELDKKQIRERGQVRPLRVTLCNLATNIPIYKVLGEEANTLYFALKELHYGRVNILIEE